MELLSKMFMRKCFLEVREIGSGKLRKPLEAFFLFRKGAYLNLKLNSTQRRFEVTRCRLKVRRTLLDL